jgi:diguanylate cyclase (GGDEF)-like protein/PAS domain S-box-containing protein
MSGRHPRWLPGAATFGGGLLLTALLYMGVHGIEEARQRAEFERGATARLTAVQEGLDNALDALATVNRLFSTMQPVTRQQFAAFTGPMLGRHLPVELIGWQAMVDEAGRAGFEAARRAQFPGYTITELSGERVVEAGRRARYRVADYLMPQGGNERALGLDADTRPEQAAAARRACLLGQPAMTGQFGLFVGNRRQPGFLVLMPVYRSGTAAGGDRCGSVLGYTTVGFSSQTLVQRTLSARDGEAPDVGSLRVYAAATPDLEQLVFARYVAPQNSAWSFLDGARPDPVSRTFSVAGRPWYMVVSPPPPRVLRDHLGSLLALLAGLAGSVGAAAFASLLAARGRAVRDMVDKRTAELTLVNHSLQLRQQAIEACVNSIVIASAEEPHYPIEYVNPAFEHINGYSAAEVTGLGFALLWGDDSTQRGVRDLLAMVRARRGGSVLMRTYRKDGGQLWCEMYVAPCTDASGEVRHYVVVQHDVTDKRRYQVELEYQATHDALTGLANRQFLRRRLHEEIAAAARARQSISVLFIDLDGFKRVNDSLGHAAGNTFLCAIADCLREAVRTGDLVARLGGDEFVLVLPERVGEALSGAAIERIMGAVRKPVTIDNQQFLVSCSVGIANYPADGDDADALIDSADRAMYAAKKRGPDQFQYFLPEMNERVRARVELERALRGALDHDQFEIVYQPWADLSSGAIAGVQARLCWRHPELGLIPPERFMPIAEESGASVALGAWLLGRACSQVSAWHAQGLGELSLALGAGMRQLTVGGLPATVEEVLAESGLPPRCLRLELTESVVAGDATQVLTVLHELRALGVRVAIDCFGTGPATLADLRRFPIDVLQMDRSFARDIGGSQAAQAIPDAIIAMAHSLGIRVLAAGVDTEIQCEVLSRNMCDEVQGELLSAPLPAEAMGELLAAGAALPKRVLRLHKRQRTLLLVDDEPNILAALKRQMRGTDCRILTAPGGQQGLELLESEPVDVIVSDQRMPGMTGVEFLRIVKNSHPDTVRMVLSGFTELQSVTDAVNEGAIYKFLTKPWDDTQLRAHIEEAFRNKEMVDENRRLGLELRTANLGLASANRQLEDVLEQQREQIRRDGISLDIVREALLRVPMAIVALDEDRQVAYANLAARKLFGKGDALLGSDADEVMPAAVVALAARADEVPVPARLAGQAYEIVAYSMGRKTRSRGTLMTFSPIPDAR